MNNQTENNAETFAVYLIKPSHYDNDGYVIQWLRSTIPSNSLAAVYGLVLDCFERRVLGVNVEITCFAYDETNTYIDVEAITKKISQAGNRGLVGFVGVQSNQFPRTMDLARRFCEADVQVCIGGFHVSGCLAMLPGIQPDLKEALDLGISLFAGEAEGRMDDLLLDAYNNDLKPTYNYLNDLPALEGAPIPFLPRSELVRSIGVQSSLDAGRGCPFKCSFCTIINVQGRKSRHRSADDVERIVRANFDQGVSHYFITDDNFARNKNWEAIFDRLIELHERDGIKVRFTLQVDTLCHKFPGFIEKAAKAGATKVFIGLESINPEALAGAQKRQNRIGEYRRMMQAWHDNGVIVFAGYIIGFPNDTPKSIVRDIGIIQRELPIDFLEFFILTPLPGSQDHKQLFDEDVWMDPDLNKYDLNHVTTDHTLMSADAWIGAYRQAWTAYYTPQHIETLFRRGYVCGIPIRRLGRMALWFHGTFSIEDVHPLEGGYLRRKVRRDRRPSLPLESPFVFYPRYWWEVIFKHIQFAALAFQYWRMYRRIIKDPTSHDYCDVALVPAADSDLDELDLFAFAQAE